MTATFGKLENETLVLQPGLNLIHAPNEWGKSTWCAFLVAMLYGIETRVHSTKTALADKERYAPWSGSPMSGRMDLNWQGRDITVERSSKGRSVLGVFRAYETASGLPVPELTAENCGQQLLGVEKSVFLRSGFLKLTDLPVTQDESLRRRLNALVTTGDESGTADRLADALRGLKNRCRANRANGLLPQAQQQKSELKEKLSQYDGYAAQAQTLMNQQEALASRQRALENHRDALRYEESKTLSQRLAQAQARRETARQALKDAEAACEGLDRAACQTRLGELEAMHAQEAALQRQLLLLPPEPERPVLAPVFQNVDPADMVRHAETDQRVYGEVTQEARRSGGAVAGILLALASLLLLLIPHPAGIGAAVLGVLVGLLLMRMNTVRRRRARETAQKLKDCYGHIPPEDWALEARRARASLAAYEEKREARRRQRQALEQENAALAQALDRLGMPLDQAQRQVRQQLEAWAALDSARQSYDRASELADALAQGRQEAPPPQFPDSLTSGPQETEDQLNDCRFRQHQLSESLGRCRALLEALGSRDALEQELAAVESRIQALERTLDALDLAQQTLTDARAQLQRRFAPRIAQRAQDLFSRLTDGRYDRVTLGEDLTLQAGAAGETVLHEALWRSDGTVDQLYLALRLAVAEALIPQAPFVLDDALVRFDDTRLATALEVLQEAAQSRQVLLFSCQTRETQLLHAEIL